MHYQSPPLRTQPIVIRIADRARTDGRMEGFVVGVLVSGSVAAACAAIHLIASVLS